MTGFDSVYEGGIDVPLGPLQENRRVLLLYHVTSKVKTKDGVFWSDFFTVNSVQDSLKESSKRDKILDK